MQPMPYRLSQALWTAFKAAKPVHRQSRFQHTCRAPNNITIPWLAREIPQPPRKQYQRFYSDHEKKSEIDKKAEDAKQRIEQSLESRADIAQDVQSSLKQGEDETIVHTLPEASSIVHKRSTPSDTPQEHDHRPHDGTKQPDTDWTTSNGRKYKEWAASQWKNSPLPSQVASLRSRANQRFSTFMDSLQSQIVVAAHHLNDLTGYTGIERLKKEIEAQESAVQAARQYVKDNRDSYTEAIAMRSTTQREVNDLLHRKHAWTPGDLERFTHLYRSDHANEQSEQKAHQQLSAAEAQYEEASTRLAKSILARYHEEQIWSDKIRQMSTWGTWGLMGLNVLLFILFQIAIEPWRRKRLVRGFEEKVQKALDEKERATDEKFAAIHAQRSGDQMVLEAIRSRPEGVVATAAEGVAQAIADAVTGSTDSTEQPAQAPGLEEIEDAAEQVTQRELEAEAQGPSSTDATIAATESDTSTANTTPSETIETPSAILETDPPPQTWQDQLATTHQDAMKTATDTYTHYSDLLAQQFNNREHVVLSKRELTTRVLEGVATGIALTCGLMFVFARVR